MKERQSEMARLDALKRERDYLVEQIRQSERTIERSRQLLKQLDELLARGEDNT
jgi:hypothetical protein